MKKIPLIIITGYPGVGKTTLGKHLAEKYSLPFIGKDEIKETLFDSLGWKDRDWSVKLGAASYDLLFYFVEQILKVAKPFIIETWFSKISEKEINILKEKYDFEPIQIVCHADPKVIINRVKNRVDSGERHPGHVDHTRYDELKTRVQSKYQPLDIGGKCMEVDMTNFKKIDYRTIYKSIEKELGL